MLPGLFGDLSSIRYTVSSYTRLITDWRGRVDWGCWSSSRMGRCYLPTASQLTSPFQSLFRPPSPSGEIEKRPRSPVSPGGPPNHCYEPVRGLAPLPSTWLLLKSLNCFVDITVFTPYHSVRIYRKERSKRPLGRSTK